MEDQDNANLLPKFVIDPGIKKLLQPLTAAEHESLEELLIREGCRDPLVTWEGILLDGHNRHEICTRKRIPFETKEIKLPDRAAAEAWVIQHQFGRRNLTRFQKCVLALQLWPLIAEGAKENQREAGRKHSSILKKPIDTNEEIAKRAGVSPVTLHKVKKILELATGDIIQKLQNEDLSIDAAYKLLLNLAKPLTGQELVAKGLVEPPRSVLFPHMISYTREYFVHNALTKFSGEVRLVGRVLTRDQRQEFLEKLDLFRSELEVLWLSDQEEPAPDTEGPPADTEGEAAADTPR